jgi:hypothetical protein
LTVAVLGGALFTAVLVAVQGNHRAPDTMAQGDEWLDELRTPKRMLVYRLKGRASSGSKSFEGWTIVDAKEFTATSPEGKALAQLFKKRRLLPVKKTYVRCDSFNASLALEFIAPTNRRVSLFDFGCEQVQGDAAIREFDPFELATWAKSIWPGDPVFEKATQIDADEPPDASD